MTDHMTTAALVTVSCRTCGSYYRVPATTTLASVVRGCRCGRKTLTVSPLAPGKACPPGTSREEVASRRAATTQLKSPNPKESR